MSLPPPDNRSTIRPHQQTWPNQIFSVMFEEYEAISGADQVQIPSFYRGKITDFAKKIKGETIPNPNGSADDDFTKATFELDLIDKDGTSSPIHHGRLSTPSFGLLFSSPMLRSPLRPMLPTPAPASPDTNRRQLEPDFDCNLISLRIISRFTKEKKENRS